MSDAHPIHHSQEKRESTISLHTQSILGVMMDLVSFCYNRSVVEKLPVCVLTGHSRHQDVHLYLTKPVCRHKQMHSLIFLGREHAHTSTSPRITWTNWDSPRDLWSCTSQRFLSLTRSIFHCTKRKMQSLMERLLRHLPFDRFVFDTSIERSNRTECSGYVYVM